MAQHLWRYEGWRRVVLVDLPAFGRPVRLVWHKRRWRCPRQDCGAGSFTEQSPQIAPERALLTTRAARWATRRAGRGEALDEVRRRVQSP
ncbi:transposase family protein [Candidatus Poriferisocius sp.]|uniref:transposase family protein n=1 Tax=Candidatus Poriferisocius sp. TaxID=3101276 RepID=UPI003B02D2DA